MTHTSRNIRNLLAVAAVAAIPIAALSACGGGDDSSSASTTAAAAGSSDSGSSSGSATAPDPCTLVTEAQATTAAGVTVTKVDQSSPVGTPQCFFSSDSAHESVDLQVDTSSASYDSMKKVAGTQGVAAIEPVSGVGDDAFFDFALGETRPSMRVKNNGVYYFINVKNDALSADQIKANEQALAQQVLTAAG